MAGDMVFTSESVTEGHPDKIADQISDAVLDAVLTDDPVGRVACETLVTTGLVLVAGEISTTATLDIPQIVRGVVREIGYTSSDYGFDAGTCAVKRRPVPSGMSSSHSASDQGSRPRRTRGRSADPSSDGAMIASWPYADLRSQPRA